MSDFSNGQTVIPSGKTNVPIPIGMPSTGANSEFCLKALKTNSAVMFFGTGAQSTAGQLTPSNGFPLSAGDETDRIPSAQGAQLYVIGTAGDSVAWYSVDP